MLILAVKQNVALFQAKGLLGFSALFQLEQKVCHQLPLQMTEF